MANKKRRRRPTPGTGGPASEAASAGTDTRTGPRRPATGAGATPVRRERKEAVRRARETARKRAVRVATLRRFAVLTAIAVAVVTAFAFLTRAAGARPIPASAKAAASAAHCSGVTTPAASAPGGLHLAAGAPYTYRQHPATSGYHDPSPLPIPQDHVFAAPVGETHAVHNLEHAGIFIYYLDQGNGALPQGVVAALKQVAGNSKNTLIAPYRDFDPATPPTALAFAAWNKLQTCPATISVMQAKEVAWGFEYAFACTSNAPEPKVSGNGC